MVRLGLRRCWHCLQSGAGGGSFARWLCAQARPAGRVLAVDADTRHLGDLPALGGEVAQLDLVAGDLARVCVRPRPHTARPAAPRTRPRARTACAGASTGRRPPGRGARRVRTLDAMAGAYRADLGRSFGGWGRPSGSTRRLLGGSVAAIAGSSIGQHHQAPPRGAARTLNRRRQMQRALLRPLDWRRRACSSMRLLLPGRLAQRRPQAERTLRYQPASASSR